MPKVLNKYNDRIHADAVYIGRPGKWGNPFVLGTHGNRQTIIDKYRTWLLAQPDMIAEAKSQLRGKDLVCFCAPAICHGDILLEIANGAP